jgi:hypothetical protein
MNNVQLKANIDAGITNKTANNSVTPPIVGVQLKDIVDYIDQEVEAVALTPGPTGPTGAQGIAGPVGPAGLEWRGVWSSATSYIADQAVSYNGASWFCISPITGATLPATNLPPNADITHWALLAAQGSPGPQGAQGIPGTPGASVQKTKGSLVGANFPNETVLIYDINLLQPGSGNSFKLPNTTAIGKEIIVDVMASAVNIYGAVSGALAFETSVNSSSSQCILAFNDLVKFTCIASNFWLIEHLQRNSLTPVALVSQQVNVSTGTNPEIKWIDYVRIFATADNQTCKLTGAHPVGKQIYVKNTTAYTVILNGVGENINGNSTLQLPPNTYWHLLKEDSGTNSITAFKLSLT